MTSDPQEKGAPDAYATVARVATGAVPGAHGAPAAVEGDSEHFVLRPCVWAGGVSDRGMSHPHNQDSLAIAAGTDARGRCAAVVAVSDGVSTSDRSAEAATIAARQAADCLADVLQAASIAPSEVSRHMRNAFRRANQAVLDAARDDLPGSWACTLVVASWWRGRLVVGNVGDSRCYWFPDDGPARLLSTDDSLAQARIELGVARRVAESGAQAHAILKWIGPGAGPCDPTMQTLSPRQDGWLVVCSDGLWNYASAADELGAVVASCLAELDEPRPPAWMLANRLTAWANAQGGHDNVSVGAVRVVVPRRA